MAEVMINTAGLVTAPCKSGRAVPSRGHPVAAQRSQSRTLAALASTTALRAAYNTCMSIAQRLEDAEFLWESGRFEGAFLSALVAFAATARRLRPSPIPDSKAFQDLFKEQFGNESTVRFRGEMVSLGLLFYKWLRCELVHEGGLPMGIEIDASDTESLFSLKLVESLPLSIPATWYHSLIINVVGHPINADQFPLQEQTLRAILNKRKLAGHRVLGPYAKRRSYRP
jgi:hypothetical protein